ncbi:hypothetical protein CONLIGDRAFT_642662 [Coniochaeta ligniaria NRRL 30616]|uniref:Uncharacterized protein n=1 Tax=Coniochaeta ligniaria NRRL 30616 TaxID=1408157 RepID=A0A1J7JMN9_9PEZI|nr:hypothetical protein CONLIGDRAFT_642662 [Coniochaeta ligniaria NRRL 30616]
MSTPPSSSTDSGTNVPSDNGQREAITQLLDAIYNEENKPDDMLHLQQRLHAGTMDEEDIAKLEHILATFVKQQINQQMRVVFNVLQCAVATEEQQKAGLQPFLDTLTKEQNKAYDLMQRLNAVDTEKRDGAEQKLQRLLVIIVDVMELSCQSEKALETLLELGKRASENMVVPSASEEVIGDSNGNANQSVRGSAQNVLLDEQEPDDAEVERRVSGY